MKQQSTDEQSLNQTKPEIAELESSKQQQPP
jgi:hypothetical protein